MPDEKVSKPVVPPVEPTPPSVLPPAAPEAPKEPAAVTQEDVRRIAREEALRTNQSMADKLENRVKKHLETLKKSGVTVTPEQEQGIRATIRNEVVEEETKPPAPGADNPVLQFVSGIMAEEGVQILDGDPEVALVTQALQDPKATQHSIHRAVTTAIDAKRQRLQTSEDKAGLRTPGALGSPVAPNDISTITDSARLYEIGEERIRRGKK